MGAGNSKPDFTAELVGNAWHMPCVNSSFCMQRYMHMQKEQAGGQTSACQSECTRACMRHTSVYNHIQCSGDCVWRLVQERWRLRQQYSLCVQVCDVR